MIVWTQSVVTGGYLLAAALIISCLKSCSGDRILFTETVEGTVDFGNYTHYSYNGDQKLTLVLTTLSGDADLYVSQADSSGRPTKPRYDYHEHDLQSVTCGQDVVHIDIEFRRPIGIAVYGHPSHESSRYSLDVMGVEYFDDNDRLEDKLYGVTDDELDFYEEFFGEPFPGLDGDSVATANRRKSSSGRVASASGDHRKRDHRSDDEKSGKGSDTWEFILNLLANILHILLEAIL